MAAAHEALDAVPAEVLDPGDGAAIIAMREGLVTAASYSLPGDRGRTMATAPARATRSSTPVACARSMRRSPRLAAP